MVSMVFIQVAVEERKARELKVKLIMIFSIVEISDHILLHQSRDLGDTLRDSASCLIAQLLRYSRKGDPVVARIFSLVNKLDHSICSIGSNHLNELLFLEILICCPNIEHTASDKFRPEN